jgi:hypothetical protein
LRGIGSSSILVRSLARVFSTLTCTYSVAERFSGRLARDG